MVAPAPHERRLRGRGRGEGQAAHIARALHVPQMRQYMVRSQDRQPSTLEILGMGGLAGAAAAAITNPLDLVTTRLMAQGADKPFGSGMMSVLRTAADQGFHVLWRGTIVRAISHMPYTAIQFSLYEIVLAWLNRRYEGPPCGLHEPLQHSSFSWSGVHGVSSG